MAKRINTTRIKIIFIGVVMTLLVLSAIAAMLVSGKNATAANKTVEPAFAPAEYAYPEYFLDTELEDGYSWKLNESNRFELTSDDGSKYMVLPDGSIYKIEDDGSLSEIADDNIRKDVFDKIIEASEDSDSISDYFDIEIPLSDNEIAEMVGDKIPPDEFRKLQQEGLTPEEIAELINAGYSPEDILEALKSGIKSNSLSEYLDRQDRILDELEQFLSGTGITIDELIAELKSMGITPEEYLNALKSSNLEKEEASTPVTSYITASDLPPMTISLGGSDATVIEKENDYQDYIDSLNAVADPSAMLNAINGVATATPDYVQQNDQKGKNEFMQSFSSNSGYDNLTKNDIAPGTVITMILKTGINSDLPGQIVAEVTHNVYDSLTGSVLLIPKGTRLIATYSSSVSWGQERALVAWTQLIRPDGLILNLPGLPGIDGQGYAGYNDKVNNHIWDLIWGAALASILDVGSDELKDGFESIGNDAIATILGNYSDNLTSVAQEYLSKVINQQPTLTIRPGRTIKLLVTQKLTLRPYLP